MTPTIGPTSLQREPNVRVISEVCLHRGPGDRFIGGAVRTGILSARSRHVRDAAWPIRNLTTPRGDYTIFGQECGPKFNPLAQRKFLGTGFATFGGRKPAFSRMWTAVACQEAATTELFGWEMTLRNETTSRQHSLTSAVLVP